jgi:tight adherence protein C
MMISTLLFITSPIITVLLGLLGYKLYLRYKYQQNIILLSKLDTETIISQQQEEKKSTNQKFNLKLLQAGVTLKEYNEARLMYGIIGVIFAVVFPFFITLNLAIFSVIVGVLLITFGGELFLSQKKGERVQKIERDLGTFLDLINVILEAGGGLNNAFFQVSKQAKGIIDEELLKEIAILEYEMSNYSTKQAYENLKMRVGSKELDSVVDFLLLNEETGIGVKNIFSTQSDEMRQKDFYRIKGKASTLNLYLTLIIFVFILPALGAFVIFPLMAGKLNLGL